MPIESEGFKPETQIIKDLVINISIEENLQRLQDLYRLYNRKLVDEADNHFRCMQYTDVIAAVSQRLEELDAPIPDFLNDAIEEEKEEKRRTSQNV